MELKLVETPLINNSRYLVQIDFDSFYSCQYDITSHCFWMLGFRFTDWLAVFENPS